LKIASLQEINNGEKMMNKIDFKKELKHLYNPPSREVLIVDVPKMNFLMADGTGNPNNSQQYKEAIEALYAVSYTLKFMIKKGKMALDYGVMPLEGLWWTDDINKFSVRYLEMDSYDHAAGICFRQPGLTMSA
jgi:hypothetical protein